MNGNSQMQKKTPLMRGFLCLLTLKIEPKANGQPPGAGVASIVTSSMNVLPSVCESWLL